MGLELKLHKKYIYVQNWKTTPHFLPFIMCSFPPPAAIQSTFPPCDVFPSTSLQLKVTQAIPKSPLVHVLLKSFWNNHLRKYSREKSWLAAKTNPSHLWEKWEHSRQIPHKSSFLRIICPFFYSEPNLKFLISHLSKLISVFNLDF